MLNYTQANVTTLSQRVTDLFHLCFIWYRKSKRRCGRPKTSTVKTYSRKEPKRNIVRDPFSSEDVIQFPVDTSDALTDTTGVRSKSHVSHLVSRSNLALATHNGTSFMIDAPLPSKIEPSLLDDATATRGNFSSEFNEPSLCSVHAPGA